jgi:acyl-CoA reductase-like NAD-dependent aldehyde dehydrogenase
LYLFTDSKELEKRVVNETSAGSISINETVIHVSFFHYAPSSLPIRP